MSDLALVLVGIGIGLALAGGLLGQAWQRIRILEAAAERARTDAAIAAAKAETDHAIEVVKAEALQAALGMVRDITQVRAATPVSLTPKLDAIEAERAAWAFSREKQIAEASDKRFNDEMDGKAK